MDPFEQRAGWKSQEIAMELGVAWGGQVQDVLGAWRSPTPTGPGLARWTFTGECLVASIRLEAQAPPPGGPSPVVDPRYAVWGTQRP